MPEDVERMCPRAWPCQQPPSCSKEPRNAPVSAVVLVGGEVSLVEVLQTCSFNGHQSKQSGAAYRRHASTRRQFTAYCSLVSIEMFSALLQSHGIGQPTDSSIPAFRRSYEHMRHILALCALDEDRPVQQYAALLAHLCWYEFHSRVMRARGADRAALACLIIIALGV